MMHNIVKGFIFISFIFNTTIQELPQPFCLNDKPFLKNDRTCADFNDICVKIGDQQCDNFKATCQQCPPTNLSFIMFQDILYLKKELANTTAQFQIYSDKQSRNFLKLETKIKELQSSAGKNLSFSITILIFLLLFLIILLLEIRFRLFSKLFQILSKSKYKTIRSSDRVDYDRSGLLKAEREGEQLINFKNELKEILYVEKSLIQNVKDELKEEIGKVKESLIQNVKVESNRLKFYIMKEMIDLVLQVHENDNVVKLKRQIMDRIEGRNPNDYKRIKMKYKGLLLDDNKYLLSCIDSPEIPIFCEFDENININETITLKLRANFTVPDMVQIELSQTIGNLKGVISVITGCRSEELMILKESNELETETSVETCGLCDGDWIQVIKTHVSVTIQSLLHSEIPPKSLHSSNNTVLELKEKLANELECDIEYLSLFMKEASLMGDHHRLNSELSIKYCNFTDPKIYETGKILLDRNLIKLFEAKKKENEEKVLLKSYDYSFIAKDKNTINAISENLLLFVRTKSHPRFMKLLDIYLVKNVIYLAIENTHGTTLNGFVDNTANWPIKEYEISKWARQILESLEYIHQYDIIYMDLNPFNVFIDGNHNIKLMSFNWNDYLNNENLEEIMYQLRISIIKYISPEIINRNPFGVKADVWSLGVILIKIFTHQDPYPTKGDRDIIDIIRSRQQIEYKNKEMSKEFTEFIDLCLIYDVDERAPISRLMQTNFITKYL